MCASFDEHIIVESACKARYLISLATSLIYADTAQTILVFESTVTV